MNFVFNYHASAARKARLFVAMTSVTRLILMALSFVSIVSGVLLLASNTLIGLGVIGVGIWFLLPLIWYKYELSHLPARIGTSLETSLSSEVVGRLASTESPFHIWQAVHGTHQQRFFSLRFGILPELFDQLITHDADQTQTVLADAHALAEKHQLSYITTGAILVALIDSIPNSRVLLAEMSLSIEDLEESIDWLHHHESVLHRLGAKSQFGGLARNWIGGYTPRLNELAHNMTEDIEHGGFMHRDLSVHSQTVKDMIPLLSQSYRNAVLVGGLGAGKTTTVFSFAQSLLVNPKHAGPLGYNHVLALDAATLISHSPEGSIEALLQSLMVEANRAQNIILFFDQASLFFKEGRGSVDIGNLLEPVVSNGKVPVILALEPTEWQVLKKKYPSFASRTNVITMPEPSKAAVMQILEDQTLILEAEHDCVFMYQALKEAYRLSGHYMSEIAMPGRAIKALEMSVGFSEKGIVTQRSVQLGIESAFGVKVQATTKAAKKELLNLEDKIHTRMINQTRAVKVVADALRRSQSGVGNTNKPIGTFLFLGPTGVGKTQLSKAIAAEYFSGEDAIVRIDMNEFVSSEDVARLVDADSPQSMLAQVQRNPFSVVLLDEIEKAHPDVVNAMLQMLDEGVMHDKKNTSVSFKDTIVIATSNAGADQIRTYIDNGKEVKDFEDEFVSSLIDSKAFKPEFLNRFDETVVFRPLKPDELLQLVDMLLSAININLHEKQVEVVLTKAAKQWLVDEGYDARLGARPLRRTVQRSVENIVAKRLLEDDSIAGKTIKLDVKDLEDEVKT